MKNYLVEKNRYYLNYAEAIYKDFLQMRFGLKACTPAADEDLSFMRKELVDWQENEDNGALTATSISYVTWLGVNYDLDEIENSTTGAGWLQSPTPIGPNNLSLNYNYANGQSQNIVDINAGGCITRINLNPSIQITHNSKFVFQQPTPALVWTINHSMNMVPNVFVQDLQGRDIEGLIEPINNNALTITFSSPVAGTAYLS